MSVSKLGAPTIGYAGGKPPWIDCGADVSEMELAQAWDTTGLNFTVSQRPLMTAGKSGFIGLENHFATVRDDTEHVFGVVGKRYDISQPAETLSVFERIAGDSGASFDTLGSFDQGRILWGMLRLADLDFEASPGDVTRRYLLGVDSFDGSTSRLVGPTDMRVACANTFAHGYRDAKSESWLRVKHTASQRERIEAGMVAIRRMMEGHLEHVTTCKAMARKEITVDTWGAALDLIFPLPAKKADGSQPNTGKSQAIRDRVTGAFHQEVELAGKRTAWAAFNAVTGYVNHLAGGKDGEMRFKSALLGAQAAKSAQAWEMFSAISA